MSKFTPDVEIFFDSSTKKFLPSLFVVDLKEGEKTFCISNKLTNALLENQDNCHFFNITMPDGQNDWWWAYSYNLLFQAIDFDWDNDVWLCKVLGYLE